MTLVAISLLALVLFINVSDVSAATTSLDQTSIVKSTDNVKKQVETKHTVPTTVTVGNKKVTSAQYLYLITKTTSNINKKSKTAVTVKTVSKASKPSESVRSGTLTKSEYLTLAGKITTYINKNGRLPNYITTSKGKMRSENLIYTYSKILAFYKTNHRLPKTVSVKAWSTIVKTSSGEGAPITGSVQARIDAIGYQEAKYRRAQGNSSPTRMEIIGWGDCWASSSWLYNHLSAAGVTVRIVQSSGAWPLHRWAQINTGNGWVSWNYGKYNSKHIGATSSSYYVVKAFTG